MRIYFSGIGGVGIGPLAEIALDAGYDVIGSDQQQSLMTNQLLERGVRIELNQDGNFLLNCHEDKAIDWFVYTAALPIDHPELQKAAELGIKVAKRDELLAYIIREKNLKLIAVSGTHGKTTTTGMLIWALHELNIPVSYSVGTTLSFGPSGQYVSESEYFVYECDEFDRNMLAFHPYLAIIASVGYDHTDTYPTIDDYQTAFQQFAHQSKNTILWQHDANAINFSEPSAWILQPDDVATLALPGEHNRQNATLVLKALERVGVGDNARNISILEHFPGVNRRFEKLTNNLYSDYGHHPKEIFATLQLAREISDHVVLVYQPHQNVRQHEVRDQYKDCFVDAEKVYWLPTYLSREKPNLAVLKPEELYRTVSNSEVVTSADMNDELWDTIQSHVAQGHLVLCMGAGSIDSWIRNNLDR